MLEDMDVGDKIGLVVRGVEELVGSKESLVGGGALLGDCRADLKVVA